MKVMGTVEAIGSTRGLGRAVRRRSSFAVIWVCAVLLFQVGCESLTPLDTKPLDNAGIGYSAIKELKARHITAAEIGEIAKVRQAGLSDEDCVTLLQIFHGRGETFTAGDAIASLHQSGISEGVVLALAGMDQVGLGRYAGAFGRVVGHAAEFADGQRHFAGTGAAWDSRFRSGGDNRGTPPRFHGRRNFAAFLRLLGRASQFAARARRVAFRISDGE
jgi:hypothetical protein